jgi:PadR family transcriptional regulator, regulatory protein AphA
MRLTTTSHAVMALLSLAPMSGYQLARAADRSISRFWPISKPQVYSELRRLEAEGLVSGNHVAQDKLPDKRVFELTPDGERALDRWLSAPELDASRFRVPFLVKTLVGHRIEGQEMSDLLLRYAAAAEAEQRALEQLAALLEDTPDAFYARATVLFGQRVSAAIAAWAREVDSSLPGQAIRIDPRRERPANALRLLGSLPPP